ILTVVDPVIGASEDGARLFWMDRKPENAAFRPEAGPHLPPVLAAIRTDPSASADGADADREDVGHSFPPRLGYLAFVSQPVWEMSIPTPSGRAHFISKFRWPPAAFSISSPGFSSSRSPCALSKLFAASSRSSTSKPK